jgi:hypothetical protein
VPQGGATAIHSGVVKNIAKAEGAFSLSRTIVGGECQINDNQSNAASP